MFTKKVYMAEGDWVDHHYSDIVKPKIIQHGIPIVSYQKPPLVQLYNENYWNSFTQLYLDIVFADRQILELSDNNFQDYFTRLSQLKCKAIVLFDTLYDQYIPDQKIKFFKLKVIQRTKIAYEIIKSNKSNSILVSPVLNEVNDRYWDDHLDYFNQSRNYFDVYAYSVFHDFSEHTIARSQSLLMQMLKILKKEVWVTKWSVPIASDSDIAFLRRQKNPYVPFDAQSGIQKLVHLFTQTETICMNNVKWFFTGTGRDYFSKHKKVYSMDPYNFTDKVFRPILDGLNWNFSHFMGMTDAIGMMKNLLFEYLSQISGRVNVA